MMPRLCVLVAMVSVGAACVSGSTDIGSGRSADGSVTTLDAEPDHDVDAVAPQAACRDLLSIGLGGDPSRLVEITSLVRDENEQNMVGAQVSVINATPPISSVTGADGAFSLMVPEGATLVLQATLPGHMTGLLVYVVPEGPPPDGVSYHTGMDLTTLSDETVGDLHAAAGLPRDPQRGMASVFLDLPCTADFIYTDCTGGHTITLGSASHPVVFRPDSMLEAGNTTLPGGSPEVLFLDAEVGPTTVKYASTSAWMCQTREDTPTQPICPNAFTVIRADCNDM